MTVGRMMMYQHTVIVLLLVSFASALEMPFLKQNITDEDIFLHLHDVIAKRQPEEMARGNMSFSGHRRFASNLTLDERCKRGMPLSVRWTNYGPYASLVRARNDPRMSGIGLTGIFPSVINKVLKECCHRNTRVVYGQYTATLKGMETNLSTEFPEDMTFPVGLQSMDMQVFKDFLVVPLLRAPRTTLLVPELKEQRGQTLKLFKTVRLAWPILAFIFLAAIVSGVFIWILDHLQNPDEFPTTFTHGVWEGFWWAVVTMTTVGYGDRAPRSILGRLFCVIWIVTGMSIIAIFTAMVTASLSASIQYRLVIHGSVMGAVDGSQEERIGTGMNADIKTFETPKDVVEALVETSDLKLAIMDSYLLSYYHEVIQREPVRVKANLEQPINYGLLLAQNSTYFTQCFKQFIRNNPQDIFNSIRKNLNPLKNPTDDVTEELKASQGFLHEKAFHKILYGLAGFVGAFALIGLLWECLISRHLCGKRRRKKENIPKKAKKSLMQSLTGFRLAQDRSLPVEDLTHLEMITQNAARVRQLIREYDEFYEKWIEQLKEVTGGEVEWKNLKQNDKNGSLLIVAYSDKAT